MKQARTSFAGLLAVLLVVAVLATPACGQEQVYLRSVEPSGGRPGQELVLTLRGGGFGGAQQVQVTIGDLEVWDVRVESDGVISVRVYIPDDALPGPRAVEVSVVLGQNEEFHALLADGFSVEGSGGELPSPGLESPDGDGSGLWWLLILGAAVVMLAGATVAVALTVKLYRSSVRSKWQEQAQEQELPETCRAGSLYVRRQGLEIRPGRWKVAGLQVMLYDVACGRRGPERELPPELVDRLDGMARRRLLQGEEAVLVREAGEIAQELVSLVTAWQSSSEGGRDVYLKARLEGGEASAKFVLYRCVGKPGRWQKVADWTAELKAVDRFPFSLRGPAPGETPQAYRALLQEHLDGYVRRLIEEAGRLL